MLLSDNQCYSEIIWTQGLFKHRNMLLEILTKSPVHMNRNPHQPVSWSSNFKLQMKNINQI